MTQSLLNSIRHALLCFVLAFALGDSLLAQNAAEPYKEYGLESFNSAVSVVKVQPDGKILVAGTFTYYKTTPVKGIARLNADGTLDYTFISHFNSINSTYGPVRCIALQPDGKIIIGGNFTYSLARNNLVRLNSDGTIDQAFDKTEFQATITAINLLPDGKFFVTTLGGLYANSIIVSELCLFNADGTLDNSFKEVGPPASNVISIYCTAVQSDGKIVVGGYFSSYNGLTRNNILRFNADYTLDLSFNPSSGASNQVSAISIQSDGKILIGGAFNIFNGSSRRGIARLNSDGSLDNTFDVGSGLSASNQITSITIQPNDQILITGNFSTYNGIARCGVARLNKDGSLDNSLDPGPGFANINNISLQSDDKILICGGDINMRNEYRRGVARLSSAGVIEDNFNEATNTLGVIGPTNNCNIFSTVVQPNDKIIIAGSFLSYKGILINNIARLNPDMTLDKGFHVGSGTNAQIDYLCLQSDGKIIAAGSFSSYNGTSVNKLMRLNSDGSLDNSFNVGLGIGSGNINAIVKQPDGKILIGGNFSNYNGVICNKIARLNDDGSLDNNFSPGTKANSEIKTILLQPDGKIILGGLLTSYNGVSVKRIVRLNPDGSIDNSFQVATGVDSEIRKAVLLPDGKIVVGGIFSNYGAIPTWRLARLHPDGTLDNTFNVNFGETPPLYTMTLQADGKILVGGEFYAYDGISLVRVNLDGSIDHTFNVQTGVNYRIYSISILSDGQILLGGRFTQYKDLAFMNLVLLRGDLDHFNTIRGSIYKDHNQDCISQFTEKKIHSMLIKALPGAYYGMSDGNGNYNVKVDSGTVSYTLTQELNGKNSKFLINQCVSSHTVALVGTSKDTSSFDFADSIKQCTLLNVSIQNSRMQRCFRNFSWVNYCNSGNSPSSGAQIQIEYPPYVIPLSSVPMWTYKHGNVLIYDLGTITAGACGRIIITDSVVCGDETIRGLTQCIKATISPLTNCVSENPDWDHSSIKVRGTCKNEVAAFTIKNSGTGNMDDSLQYRIFMNDTLGFISNFKLLSGDSLIVYYPSEGQTIRLEADQSFLHPGTSRPRAIVESCGAGFIRKGFVNTSPQDDIDEEIAITCNVIIDGYDPNDKQVIPVGTGSTNQVFPGEELEFVIRFQNTGTDTAYTVSIVDTLDMALDVASFTQGATSHPYKIQVTGKGQAVVAFNFYNINLPDSTTNKAGSNGLVSYRIAVPSSAAIGTIIRNKAYIYFDYNSPIITNETMNTVGVNVNQDLSKGNRVQVVVTGMRSKFGNAQIKLYPNPSMGTVTVETPISVDHMEFKMYSMLGVLQKSISLNKTNLHELSLEGIDQGVYIYEIWQQGIRQAGGIFQLR